MTTTLPVEPTVEVRPAQPYVAILRLVTMQTMNESADRLPEVFGWLAAHGVEPAGAPFLKYNVIDMEHRLEVEAGVPVGAAPMAGDQVLVGVLPAGRYAAVTHVGSPDELMG